MEVEDLRIEIQDLHDRAFKYTRLKENGYTVYYRDTFKYLIKI